MFLFCEHFLPGGSIDRPRGLVSVGLGTRIARRSESVRSSFGIRRIVIPRPHKNQNARTSSVHRPTRNQTARGLLVDQAQPRTQAPFTCGAPQVNGAWVRGWISFINLFVGHMQDVGAPCGKVDTIKLCRAIDHFVTAITMP